MLLDDLEEKEGYWRLKEEAVDRTVWKNCFERRCRSVIRQAKDELINFFWGSRLKRIVRQSIIKDKN
jgi:hypothetical protein